MYIFGNSYKYLEILKGKIILVEGLPGSGKTTFCHELSRYLNSQEVPTKLFEEKIDEGLLRKSIENPQEYAYIFQMSNLSQRIEEYKFAQYLSNQGYCVILDRSLVGDLAYLFYQYSSGRITEGGYEDYVNKLNSVQLQAPFKVIYLNVRTKTLIERIRGRGRSVEGGFDENFISPLAECYKRALDKASPQTEVQHIDWEYSIPISAICDSIVNFK